MRSALLCRALVNHPAAVVFRTLFGRGDALRRRGCDGNRAAMPAAAAATSNLLSMSGKVPANRIMTL